MKATIYGIVLNTVQSLASVPELMANGMIICKTLHTLNLLSSLLLQIGTNMWWSAFMFIVG